ncbi:RNA-directed DNA polymerase, eukaryota, reverse transcriptase zinc-binding domain protein [Tanacetum coccineum]
MDFRIRIWNVRGMSTSDKQNEVAKFITDENLQVCATLETHLKSIKLYKACDKAFGKWNWISNVHLCSKGCRIIVGWNRDLVIVNCIHMTEQTILCILEDISSHTVSFVSFVYAANGSIERRNLWVDLDRHKHITTRKPWIIGGDMNVILNTNEHFAGVSFVSSEMHEFKDCVNLIKVEDLCSSGMFFTWTKNLKKAREGDETGVLKKLDRVMVNEDFLKKYDQAHVIFNPYLVSDHSQAVIIIPNSMKKKKKAFRFANFVADKESFIPIVKKGWKIKVDGFQMFQLVKKNKEFKDSFEEAKLAEYYEVKEIDKFYSLFKKKISNAEALSLVEVISSKEIKDALFDIGDNKAFGPDGYSVVFFKKAWKVIANDFCKAVKEFFNSGNLLKELNSTVVSLIPETQSPLKVTDYIPIACCNVVYKCISKVITGRIKKVLGKSFSKVMIEKGGPSRFAFKVDIQKDYDTVNWSFLETNLTQFSFHEKMIKWIMICVKTTSFTINVNGELCGFFKGGRGLRQGDPMSPYLFTLVMECFTLMMERNVQRNPNFQFHFGCKSIKITHVCFADDLLVLCHGDAESVKVVETLLMNLENVLTVLKEINNLLMGFLWCNGELSRDKEKIAWKKICKPKSHGGLGLKDLEIWNKALLNFWKVSADTNDSWGWKNLLEIRDEISKHVWYKLGDGMKTLLWYDNWCEMGPLCRIVLNRSIYSARLTRDMVVVDMVNNGEWNWPSEWKTEYPIMRHIKVPKLNTEKGDWLWEDKGERRVFFRSDPW